jgi:hypothetical protein
MTSRLFFETHVSNNEQELNWMVASDEVNEHIVYFSKLDIFPIFENNDRALNDEQVEHEIANSKVNESLMTHQDIVTAYRLFLRREPENQEVVKLRVGAARDRILSSFLMSSEFLVHLENIKLVFESARLINSNSSTDSKVSNGAD